MAAWKARGSVPALLEVTADLVSCVVHEEECTRNLQFCGDVLRLMRAAAVTRYGLCPGVGLQERRLRNNTGGLWLFIS